jgi:adenine-specific DNA-methyltransferase
VSDRGLRTEVPKSPKSCRVPTPRPLATALAAALGDSPRARWLEPCVGGGALLESLRDLGVPATRIRGIDLDECSAPTDALASTLRGTEFLAWARGTTERFDRIIANPPYVALHRLPERIRTVAAGLTAPDGRVVAQKANLWYAFTCALLTLLRPSGHMGLILPAAWDFARYAAPLRHGLSKLFREVEIHRCAVPLFPSVREGSVVVIGRGFGEASNGWRREEHASGSALLAALIRRADGEISAPCSSPNTTGPNEPSMGTGGVVRAAAERPLSPSASPTASIALRGLRNIQTVRFSEVFSLRLGGVTGHAHYFLMTDAERRERGLPKASVRPVVTRAHHLSAAKIDRKVWEELLAKGERVWLFWPTDTCLGNEAVQAYLNLETRRGGCNRTALKIRSRQPWYRTPLPTPVHGFVSGMSRHGPWLALNEMHRLNATNTLYVVHFQPGHVREDCAAWGLSLLSSVARTDLEQVGRRYPDGLVKYEPGDLAHVRLPVPSPAPRSDSLSVYIDAVARLVAGDAKSATSIADEWCHIGL